jgi:transcriptional regulator with XRE-family HTH domain
MARSPAVEEAGSDVELGTRLRELRASRGLSLRSAAARAGVTPGALSQIENGRNSPSVSTLKKVLGAMGSSLGEFFGAERKSGGSGFVYRSAELVRVGSGRGGIRFLGLPRASSGRAIQFLRETYAPGADTGAESYAHEGEEGGFCISGSVEITVAGRREVLGPGDAYYYSSKLPHRWRNVGRVPAVVISGCTPPSF